MQLTTIELNGYKSIDTLSFDINKIKDSYTKVFLGKNETGKSSILEAMALAKDFYDERNFDFLALKNQLTSPEYIDVYYTMVPTNTSYRATIEKYIDINEVLLNSITIESVTQNIYGTEEADDGPNTKLYNMWSIKLNEIDLTNTYYKEQKPVVNDKRYIVAHEQSIPAEELESYILIDQKKFSEIILEVVTPWLNTNRIKVSVWKAEPEYLIGNEVSLDDFYTNPVRYPLLMNVFKISGYETVDKIKNEIDIIRQSKTHNRKLERELTTKTTQYLNRKWKEYNNFVIDIRIENAITIMVQDKDKPDNFYNPSERSDGFKQFASLLLSISADNEAGTLKNNLILIDEPEIHLHPSGIRDMMQELLLLGKNNYVFVSTHSNFMLDADAKERHYIVKKKKGLTTVKQIASHEDLNDDEILQAAFGINVIRDFIAPKKLLVEGLSDKKLLQKALKKLNPDNDILITNGRGDSIKPEAAIMNYHDISPKVVVDDDEAGQGYKNEIIALGGAFSAANVFTLRDLNGDVCHGGTIEDCLPKEYIQGKANEVLHDARLPDIELAENTTFCLQLLIHLQQGVPQLPPKATKTDKENREKYIYSIIRQIKTKIAEDFNDRIPAPKLETLAQRIIELF